VVFTVRPRCGAGVGGAVWGQSGLPGGESRPWGQRALGPSLHLRYGASRAACLAARRAPAVSIATPGLSPNRRRLRRSPAARPRARPPTRPPPVHPRSVALSLLPAASTQHQQRQQQPLLTVCFVYYPAPGLVGAASGGSGARDVLSELFPGDSGSGEVRGAPVTGLCNGGLAPRAPAAAFAERGAPLPAPQPSPLGSSAKAAPVARVEECEEV
jgi:hypothetical protein